MCLLVFDQIYIIELYHMWVLQHDDVQLLCVYGYCSEERKRRSRHDNLILLSEFYGNPYRDLSSYSFSFLLYLPFLNAIERWSVFIHNSDLDENLRPTMSIVCGLQLCRCTNVHLALKQKYISLLLVVVVVSLMDTTSLSTTMRCELSYNHPFILQNDVKCVLC